MLMIVNQNVKTSKTNLPYFEIQELASITWLRHAFLTRKGGVSLPPFDKLNLSQLNGDRDEYTSRNKELVATAFSFDSSRLAFLGQVHQDRILVLGEPLDPVPRFSGYDAAITSRPNIFLGILTADCLPILIVDRLNKVVAAVHAGRQGTALGIVTKVLREMKARFDCSYHDLLIAMGPRIGGCCYEIDEKVFQPEWEPFSISSGYRKWLLDITAVNISQMIREGIAEDQIFRIDLCTRCNPDLFFSYRNASRTGRQLSFIGMV